MNIKFEEGNLYLEKISSLPPVFLAPLLLSGDGEIISIWTENNGIRFLYQGEVYEIKNGKVESLSEFYCKKCKVKDVALYENPQIHDGWCVVICNKCGHIEVRDRFKDKANRIIAEIECFVTNKKD